jgi:hypothetical protein
LTFIHKQISSFAVEDLHGRALAQEPARHKNIPQGPHVPTQHSQALNLFR